jgi:PIN domain nuclease of toxin-antitoxin system
VRLLDASAVIAFLRDEPARPEIEALLRESGTAMSAINLAEVVDQLARRGGLDAARVEAVLSGLIDDALAIVPCGTSQALLAGALRAKHYHRRDAPLSLGDCVLLATAQREGATVVSSDRALLRAARAEGVATAPVRDSAGRKPR